MAAEGEGHTFHFDYDKRAEEYYALIVTISAEAEKEVKEVWYNPEGETKRVAD